MNRVNVLTKEQLNIYNTIVKYYDKNYESPTVREIAEITKKSITTVWNYLNVIERKGYIEIERQKWRGIKIAGVDYDKYVYNSENDFKKEENESNGLSKSD